MARKRKRATLRLVAPQLQHSGSVEVRLSQKLQQSQLRQQLRKDDIVLHATMPHTLTRYMERQMELGGQMNSLYGINFYADEKNNKFQFLHSTIDVESELIQLRLLLLPHDLQQQQQQQQQQPEQQQQQLQDHVDRLKQLSENQLAVVLEDSFLCGMLDVAQLQQLQQLLPQQQSLRNFYRRLSAELPNFRYNMCLPKHIAYLQQYLMLHELNPRPQARRLLNASLKHMTQLQLPQLRQFLNTFNPSQLQQLILQLSCSYIQLPCLQQQRLHQTAQSVLRGKPKLQLCKCNVKTLQQLLDTPVDNPMTMQHRRHLQHFLDHLLPMFKSKQFHFLQNLKLNSSRLRQFRLKLHNPALLSDPLQLRQLYFNLKQLCPPASRNFNLKPKIVNL